MNHNSQDTEDSLQAEMRRKIDVGLEQLDRGESIAAVDVFRELRKRNMRYYRAHDIPKSRSDSDTQ